MHADESAGAFKLVSYLDLREIPQVGDQVDGVRHRHNWFGKYTPSATHVGVGQYENPSHEPWINTNTARAFTIPCTRADANRLRAS